MSFINTRSKFYYGYVISDSNFHIDFNEGAGELTAELSTNSYTLQTLATEVQTKLNAVGSDTYTVTVDRATRLYTISSTGTFSLLGATGTNSGESALSTLGFSAVDTSTAASQVSDSAAGTEFKPQFYLQRYISKEDFQEAAFASINKSANGDVEAVTFGDDLFYEFNIEMQTDEIAKGEFIEADPSGVSNLRSFLQYATTKGQFEFMPDRDDTGTFDKVLLESIAGNRNGVGYKITEMRQLQKYFQSGLIKLRVVT